MNQVYYTLPDNIIDEWLVLNGAEAYHAFSVMRLRKGDPIMVVDGIGNGYKSAITKASSKEITCKILSRIRNFGEPLVYVTLAAGLSTGYKFDEIISRSTELGVSRFIPMITEKSKIKVEDKKRLNKKLNRWRKVAVASMKQTGRSVLPEIAPVSDFKRILHSSENPGTRILFDPSEGNRNLYDLKLTPDDKDFTIFVGPESGFSKGEIELAAEHSCEIVTLGKRVLRTENASSVAVALIMNQLGELR